MQPAWDIGPISIVTSAFLAALLGIYTVGVGLYAVRGLNNRLGDRWSSVASTFVLAALTGVIGGQGHELLPAPFSLIPAVMGVAGIIITLTFTLGRYQEKIDRFQAEFGARLNHLLDRLVPEDRLAELRRLQARFRPDQEGFRKRPHLMMGIFLAIYAGIGWGILWLVDSAGTPDRGEMGRNLAAVMDVGDGGVLVAGHFVAVSLLLGLLLMITPNELLRLRFPELSYPFKQTILRSMRKKEEGLFGAHLHILASLPLTALWLTRDADTWSSTIYAFMAVVAISIFADAASALFGRRYGRTTWFHHPGKTYLGSTAGTLTAFLVAWPLVGPWVAVAAALVFLAVDALAPRPIDISDNVLNPLALTALMVAIPALVAPWLPFY